MSMPRMTRRIVDSLGMEAHGGFGRPGVPFRADAPNARWHELRAARLSMQRLSVLEETTMGSVSPAPSLGPECPAGRP